jgi:hypothetical protein
MTMSHQYDKDIERVEQRINLVVSSLSGAPDVDPDFVESAEKLFKTAFALLRASVQDA